MSKFRTIKEKYKIIEKFYELNRLEKISTKIYINRFRLDYRSFDDYLKIYHEVNRIGDLLGQDYKELILAGNYGHTIKFVHLMEKVLRKDLKEACVTGTFQSRKPGAQIIASRSNPGLF